MTKVDQKMGDILGALRQVGEIPLDEQQALVRQSAEQIVWPNNETATEQIKIAVKNKITATTTILQYLQMLRKHLKHIKEAQSFLALHDLMSERKASVESGVNQMREKRKVPHSGSRPEKKARTEQSTANDCNTCGRTHPGKCKHEGLPGTNPDKHIPWAESEAGKAAAAKGAKVFLPNIKSSHKKKVCNCSECYINTLQCTNICNRSDT
jgi:hypothetical protein